MKFEAIGVTEMKSYLNGLNAKMATPSDDIPTSN